MAERTGPFFEAFTRMGERLSLPKVTIDDVVDHHRRNIEALQEAARNTSEGAQAAMAKQREMLEQTLADITETVQKTKLTDPPMQQVAAQTELARRTFDATVRNATQMGEIARDTSKQNLDLLRKRVEESIEEIKSTIEEGDEPPIKEA